MIIGIDPGMEKSGVVFLDDGEVTFAAVEDNDEIITILKQQNDHDMAIEMVACYGMPVGRTTFETVLWIGRFIQAHGAEMSCKVYRKDVKLFLCNSMRAKDAHVRQALLDRFPATGGGKTPQVGTKKEPGPLYDVKSHAWSALAVAITFDNLPQGGSK